MYDIMTHGCSAGLKAAYSLPLEFLANDEVEV